MKRSSSSSLLVLTLLWACCAQRSHSESKAGASDGSPTREVRTDGQRTEAPPHGSPEPEKLDSLKKEKAKEKGKSTPGEE